MWGPLLKGQKSFFNSLWACWYILLVGVRAEHLFLPFLGKKPTTFEAPYHTISTKNKTFSTPFYLSKRGVRNVWTAKTPSGIVFADLTLLFLRKKLNKENFPKILSPERGEKYFDSEYSCRDRLRSLVNHFHEKNRIKNFTPEFQPPKRGKKC